MRNLKKRAAVIAATTALALTSLTGCASFDKKEALATVGDSTISAGVANFYARYQQASIETSYGQMLGDNMWAQEIAKGTTYEKSVKDGVMDALQQFYILEDHMGDYEISLTEEETAAIQKSAAKFAEDNELKAKDLVSGDKETVAEVLRLMTIQHKMSNAMIADVDTNVSDEEAAQKSMQYVKFPFTKTGEDGKTQDLTDEEKEALKQTAADFLAGAKTADDFEAYAKEAGYEATAATFDKEATTPATEVVLAADALGEGEFTDVIETMSGLYVAKLTSVFDREATDKQKESIVNTRKRDRFTEIYEGWKKDTKIKVNEDVWAKIDFQSVGVKIKVDDSKPYEK